MEAREGPYDLLFKEEPKTLQPGGGVLLPE